MTRANKEQLPQLPQWLQELLPEPATPQLLSVTKDARLELIQPDGSSRVFDSLEEAYRASREIDLDLKVAETVAKREGKEDSFLLRFVSDIDGYSTLVLSYTDQDRLNALKRGYADFLENAQNYAAAPENFVNAWRFIDTHPAFWTAYDLKNKPLYWVQEGHTNRLRLSVYRQDSVALVELETGSHVAPEYTEHYGDWRLEVAAESYELAIIELARRVALVHNLDGTDVENSEELFEKPNWVKELEERLEERLDELPDFDGEEPSE